MKVVILCGGIGYRLKEETEFKPKPMVFIGNKPILWHIMKIYAHYGFDEFIIALGYKGDYIKDYFLNQKFFTDDFTLHTKTGRTKLHKNLTNKDDFKITFVDTGQETLPGERILRIKDFIPEVDEDFMVTYGDGISDIDIIKLVAQHRQKKTIGTITGVHPKSKYGLIVPSSDGLVKSFIEKPILDDWISGGFMIFKKSFFDYIKAGEMEHPALQRLTKENQLSVFLHEGFWYSVDTYKELEELNKIWDSGNRPWQIW